MELFTVEQIRNYIKSKDSLGDILYFLSEENIIKANTVIKVEDTTEVEEIIE